MAHPALRRLAFVFVGMFFMLPVIAGPASAADNPKVTAAMTSLKEATAKLGAPKLEGEDLFFGTTKINGDTAVVDGIKAKHDATATVFAKKGPDFVRVSTNVMKDGKRAVGSVLDAKGGAFAALKDGKPFYGVVDILGKPYDTGYEPVKDAAGETIGILYVGFAVNK